jgi:Uma2 family endonuclease
MAIARQRLTLEEFLRLPEEEPALEYWHGEVTQKVSPKGPHGALQFGFGHRIENFTLPRRLARAFTETRVVLAGVSTVPDLVVYRWERIPRDADGQIAEDFTTPPDIAVEILSPGQSRPKVIERCRWYVENGVLLAIFADPRRRTVRLFRPGGDSGDRRGTDQLDLSDVIPGFVLTVDDFFAPLDADYA